MAEMVGASEPVGMETSNLVAPSGRGMQSPSSLGEIDSDGSEVAAPDEMLMALVVELWPYVDDDAEEADVIGWSTNLSKSDAGSSNPSTELRQCSSEAISGSSTWPELDSRLCFDSLLTISLSDASSRAALAIRL